MKFASELSYVSDMPTRDGLGGCDARRTEK